MPSSQTVCGLLHCTSLCRSTREKELSLKRACHLVRVKGGKNGTTYRRDWKMCTCFFHKLDFFLLLILFKQLGKDEVMEAGGKRVQMVVYWVQEL